MLLLMLVLGAHFENHHSTVLWLPWWTTATTRYVGKAKKVENQCFRLILTELEDMLTSFRSIQSGKTKITKHVTLRLLPTDLLICFLTKRHHVGEGNRKNIHAYMYILKHGFKNTSPLQTALIRLITSLLSSQPIHYPLLGRRWLWSGNHPG